MRSLDQLDRWIAGKVKMWTARAAGGSGGKQILEIRRDILENVRDQIEPLGQGRMLLPYNNVAIRIGAEDAGELRLRNAAFSDQGSLEHDIRELLNESGCSLPPSLHIAIAVEEDAELAAAERPFRIEYSSTQKEEAGKKPAAAERPKARLTVVKGQADPAEYPILSDRVNIGRLKEVVGEKDGLRRRNDLAFDETETTVSREHAALRFDHDSGRFRIYDTGSQRGTTVFRAGRRLEVPRGPTRGVQLQSGDEIHLGEARISFEVDQS